VTAGQGKSHHCIRCGKITGTTLRSIKAQCSWIARARATDPDGSQPQRLVWFYLCRYTGFWHWTTEPKPGTPGWNPLTEEYEQT
jgi:hypothetical protein